MINLENYIRTIPDFPKKGIMFKDITTLLQNSDALKYAINILHDKYCNEKIDKVVCIESRGFVLGAALAVSLGAGFVPIRKKGKLPFNVISESYELEYGTDAMEIHVDAIKAGERILLHDDLLATGGSMKAAINLVEKLKPKIIGISFLIELAFLNGAKKIDQYDIFSLIKYQKE